MRRREAERAHQEAGAGGDGGSVEDVLELRDPSVLPEAAVQAIRPGDGQSKWEDERRIDGRSRKEIGRPAERLQPKCDREERQACEEQDIEKKEVPISHVSRYDDVRGGLQVVGALPRSLPSLAADRNVSSKWLSKHRFSVRSQHGEDGMLRAIFDRLGSGSRTCVEIGAWDGEHLSNCWHLIHDLGWRGVLIESDRARFDALQRNAETIGNVTAIHAQVGTAGPSSLDALLTAAAVPTEFDLLSIDIDNDDYFVWEALEQFTPRVVVIEVNSQFGARTERVATQGARTWTHRSGTSHASMVRLGKRKGYELAAHTGNCLFVRRDLSHLVDIDPDEWLALFDPAYERHPSLLAVARTGLGDLRHGRVSIRHVFL
jgi:hypothetical protein